MVEWPIFLPDARKRTSLLELPLGWADFASLPKVSIPARHAAGRVTGRALRLGSPVRRRPDGITR